MYNFNSSYFRKAARMQLTGQWGSAALVSFVLQVIYNAASGASSVLAQIIAFVPAVVFALILFKMGLHEDMVTLYVELFMLPFFFVMALLSGFMLLPLCYSFAVIFLRNKREGVSLDVSMLFNGYREFKRVSGTLILMSIYTFLWSLLLYIPGIVKGISYSQTMFVLYDNPELSYNKAIERSMAMMEGYKMKYFKLQLSFIGWWLLCMATCGIAVFWVMPYIYTANVHFYEFVKEEYEKNVLAAA